MHDLPAVSMAWRNGLFVHWPVPPEEVRPLVPDELDVDVREGTAWVSALPSVVEASRLRGTPRSLGLTFRQVNLRTYVRHDTDPGVYFLSLDATTDIGVQIARRLYGLPYYRASVEFERREGDEVDDEPGVGGSEYHFASERTDAGGEPARFAATYRPTGEQFRAAPDSLAAFLVERYRLYVVRDGTVWCARVEHEPWPLRDAEATVQADSLLAAAGLPAPGDDPVVRYSSGVELTVRTPFRP